MKNNVRLFPKYSKFCILSSAFCIFLAAFSFGQEIEWQNTIGGNCADQLYAIQQTSDGGYILAGSSCSDSTADKKEDSQFYDFWLVKTDVAGNIQWENTIGGWDWDMLYSLDQTNDGGYILAGYSESYSSGNGYDFFIVKTDSMGNFQWQKDIGGSGMDVIYSIQQTTDGGYILGGISNSNISFNKTENSCNNTVDYWIIKVDTSGNIQWQNTIGGSSVDMLNCIRQTTDGGYIMGGHSWSNVSCDKTENSISGRDYWVVKTNATGSVQWQNTLGGNNDDWLTSLQQTTDGGYILAGYSASGISGDKTENNRDTLNYTYDYWIIKTDALGNIQWQKTIGGNNDDELQTISQTTDGGYILGGYSMSDISSEKKENCAYRDYWIVKTNATGEIQWQNTVGGNETDCLYSIQQTIDGSYILGGWSLSGISNDKTENCKGNWDYWMVKLTDKYNSITGNAFADLNGNYIQDAGEPNLANRKITEQNTGRFAFTEQNGNYNVAVLDSGSYTVSPSLAGINYYNSIPVIHSATFTSHHQIDSLNNFTFQPTGTFNDLCITITPTSAFRSGFDASYIINYENVGTTTLSGDVIFFPWNNVTYISSNVTPASIALDSIVWNTGLLVPFQSGSITVTVNVNTGLPIGTLINSSVRIEPVAGDANPGCNYHSWEVYTIGSYDPNDILVNEDTILTTQLPSQPWLDCTIRFQNTGNDTAYTVNILNPIDTTNLELSSIEFVNSSHPVNLNWIPWQRNMEFKFNNILLPDSNINEPLSHGFVRYRIKPKTSLLAGDSVTNKAYIYFDFNAPVETNTVVTYIILPTSIFNINNSEFNISIYPNPAHEDLTIQLKDSNQPLSISIFDVLGNLKKTQVLSNPKYQIINLKSFSAGVYFLKANVAGKEIVKKIVKM